MYQLLRNFLFLFDPEKVHYFSMKSLKLFCNFGFARKWFRKKFCFDNNSLERDFWGLLFKNPVGLAAGFDKNARYLRELECLGFGFVEIGTVTPLPQFGNDKPRLFRLPEDKAIINRMGFNNDGVKKIAERLKSWRLAIGSRQKNQFGYDLIIGGNIGKNKITPNEEAWKDYEICFNELFDYVNYFVVNVSSPNTPGLRELQEKDSLKKILTHLQDINKQKQNSKPILLKIAPDLTKSQIDDVIDLAMEIKLDGLVATNTTISRELLATSHEKVQNIGTGGLSGLPVKKRSTEILKYITQKTNGQLPVIASGGIFTGEDAREKIAAGASLVQVWTGFIYEGPMIAKNICQYLAR
ncbi:MAG: quinone-dependent dihydroorotate dehydrogenase [Sphingobacteriales bacterium]|nr:quinone-dependent dihydroorotate dehydrogenase [Sphingobacteriales bacterium]